MTTGNDVGLISTTLRWQTAALAAGLLLLAGCATRTQAPVVERPPLGATTKPPVVAQQTPVPGLPAAPFEVPTYTVKKGDTLYFIALDHGHDYKDIAAWNSLDNPDRISVGQVLRMGPPGGAGPAVPTGNAQVSVVAAPQRVEARPIGSPGTPGSPGVVIPTPAAMPTSPGSSNIKTGPKTGKDNYSEQPATPATAAPRQPDTQVARADTRPDAAPADDDKVDWGWPAKGKVLGGFSEATNKGVDISAKLGDPVIASASGKVVYSGTGLRGYGKLIIIKHNANYLSAYAHNNEILVKEGQAVVKGQKIAEVGSTDAEQPMLHFEIRKQGKPVDPLKYLPAQ
jgi:lipoprotein NlpD